MNALTGSEKQIAYAESIRSGYKSDWDALCLKVINNGGSIEKVNHLYGELVKKLFANESASFWIEKKGDTIQNLLKGMK